MIRLIKASTADNGISAKYVPKNTINKADKLNIDADDVFQLKSEDNILLRYFIWEAMCEQKKFCDEKEEFICLLSLVFRSREEYIHDLYNKSVFRNSKRILDLIKIGYQREILVEKMRDFNEGKEITVPEREKFAPRIEEMKSVQSSLKTLYSTFKEMSGTPATDLFNRFGAWIRLWKNHPFSSDEQAIECFITKVVDQKTKNIEAIFAKKPRTKYSEWLIRKKLQEFNENGGKIHLTSAEKLENIKQIETKKEVSVDTDQTNERDLSKIAEMLNIDKNDERLRLVEEMGKKIFKKCEYNNKDMDLKNLIDNSTFSVSIRNIPFSDIVSEISYLYRIVFLPLKNEGFFKDNENAMNFFMYKVAEITDHSIELIIEAAAKAGIPHLVQPTTYNTRAQNFDYSEFFVNDTTSGDLYEVYKRFREDDFSAVRYEMTEESDTKLYFLNIAKGFKQQKDLYFDIRSNAKVSQLNTLPLVNNRKESDRNYDRIAENQGDIGSFSCFLVEDDKIVDGIGTVELDNLDDINQIYNLAYLLKPQYQGKLLGYCMVKAMIDYIISLRLANKIKPLCILALIHRNNAASKSLIKKLNFRQLFGENAKAEFWAREMVCNKFLLEV